MAAGAGEEDADPGVLDPPGGAGVLPGDAGRPGPPLEEAGLVEDQGDVRVAERLDDVGAEVVADRAGVPFGPAHEVLDAVGVGVADLLGDLPGVLPLDRPEQADEVGADPVAGLAPRGSRPDPAGHPVELLAPFADVFGAYGGADAGHVDPPWVFHGQAIKPVV